MQGDGREMNILIPMAGAGSRFSQAGYKVHKPAILTTDRRSGNSYPMVICATMDLPGIQPDGSNLIYVMRDFHESDGMKENLQKYYAKARFITVNHLTEGQASTCMLAKELIDSDEELLIAGCDNGMVFDSGKFTSLCKSADVMVFTYRHNEAVEEKPEAYGWVYVDKDDNVIDVSIKKPISDTPKEDHAIVATFWFRHGRFFVEAAEKMIGENDRVNGEFYVDQVIKHALTLGMKVKVFEIDRYIGWGTPRDYESYQATIAYWSGFVNSKYFLGQKEV